MDLDCTRDGRLLKRLAYALVFDAAIPTGGPV